MSGLIRIDKSLSKTNDVLKKNSKKIHFFNGIIHGLTNMGGGFLALLSSSIFQDKINIRNNIAFGYLLMGTLQYSLFFFLVDSFYYRYTHVLVGISLFSFFILGKILFAKISNFSKFDYIFNYLWFYHNNHTNIKIYSLIYVFEKFNYTHGIIPIIHDKMIHKKDKDLGR